MSETFRKSKRGSRLTSDESSLEDGNGTALLEALRVKENGIGDVEGFSLGGFKEIFRRCFATRISK